MPRAERGHVSHQSLGCKPVDNIGKEDRQRTLAVPHRQISECGGVVGFDESWLHNGQYLEHLSQTSSPPLRSHVVHDLIGQDHHANVVVLSRGGEGEPECSPHHVLHAWLSRNLSGEQTTGIEHQQHLLAPLFLELPRHHLAAPCRSLPVDMPGVVPGNPFP